MTDDQNFPGERSYLMPPVIEVVCQFSFAEEISHTIPDWSKIHTAFSPQYPYLEEAMRQHLGIESKEKQFDESRKISKLARFRSPDKRRVIQLGDGAFSLHQLHPYTRWADYLPFVESALSTYQNIKPQANPQECVLRYINKLVLEERDVEVTDYLKLYPKLPEGFPGLEDFHCEVLFPGDLDEEQLRVIVMSGRESESNANSLLIDLNLYRVCSTK